MFKNYALCALAALFMLNANAYNDGFDVIRPDGREKSDNGLGPDLVEVELKGGGTRLEFRPVNPPFNGQEQHYNRNEHKDNRYYDQN